MGAGAFLANADRASNVQRTAADMFRMAGVVGPTGKPRSAYRRHATQRMHADLYSWARYWYDLAYYPERAVEPDWPL